MLSRKAQKLYDAITARGGGIVDEYLIKDMTGLSHGSIVAARHELIEAGLLTLSKACRKMVYHLTGKPRQNPPVKPAAAAAPLPAAAPPKIPAAKAIPAQKPLDSLCTFTTMPHIAGTYYDFDEWSDEVNATLGGCVEISESLVEDGVYMVYSHDYETEDTYYTETTDEGFVVT